MRKHAGLLIATFLGLCGFAAFVVWAFLATARTGGGWASLLRIWPYVLGGVVATGGLTGVLMWLAFYSANRGYDDRINSDDL
jgi:hypothetical protein